MNTGTRTAIEALLNADPDVTPGHRRLVLEACDHPDGRPAITDGFLTTEEAAARLGVTRRTLFRWIKAGHLHPDKVNNRLIMLPVAEVDALIDNAPTKKGRPRTEPAGGQATPQGETPDRLNAALEHAQHRKEGTA